MAIDLPPAIPPTLVDAQSIADYAGSASAYVGIIGSFELRVTGDHHLTNEDLQKIFEAAKSADQAILLIGSATNRKGHLLVNTLYSREQNVVYVHALQGRLAQVTGAESITGYFDGLEGDPDLTRREFHTARAMANIKSGRTGVDYSVSYQLAEADPAQVTMVVEEKPDPGADRTDLKLKLSNEGSRFAGRYFADAGLTHNTMWGTQLNLDYQQAIPEWGESREGDDYEQYSVGASHPFSFGLYGVRYSLSEYTQDFTSTGNTGGGCAVADPILGNCIVPTGAGTATASTVFDAEVSRLTFTGEQVLNSDLDRQLSLYQELELVDSQIDDEGGAALQDEVYTTLELGGRYQRRNYLERGRLNYTLAASVKGGIDDDGGTLDSAPSGTPGVTPGKRVGDFIVIKPRVAAEFGLSKKTSINWDFAAQVAEDQLPQQQQWVLGGVNSISSHLPGVLVGDSGLFTRLGLKHRFADTSGFSLSGTMFGEYGRAEFEDVSGIGELSISALGVGFKAQFGESLEVDLVVAESVDEENLSSNFLEQTEADFFAAVKWVL